MVKRLVVSYPRSTAYVLVASVGLVVIRILGY